MPRDIRELAAQPDEYAAELRRRWGGLLSYRYIGRAFASMDVDVDDTVTLRHDMRDAAGGLLLAVLGISSPEGGGDVRPRRRPQPGHPLVPDPRSGRDVRRIEVLHRVAAARSADELQPLPDRRRRPPRPGARGHRGPRRRHRHAAGGTRADAVDPIEIVDAPDLPPLWQVFGAGSADRRPVGAPRADPRTGVARRRAAHRSAVRGAGDRRHGRGGVGRGHRPPARRVLARHVPHPGQDRAVPRRRRTRPRRRRDGRGPGPCHDEGAGDRAISTGSYQLQAQPLPAR